MTPRRAHGPLDSRLMKQGRQANDSTSQELMALDSSELQPVIHSRAAGDAWINLQPMQRDRSRDVQIGTDRE